jgi:hypothetical protein
MVPKWGAVLLLDEADVFMEARNSTDLWRNELVSIFLRMLEYYEVSFYSAVNTDKLTHHPGHPLPHYQPRWEH